MELKHTTVSAFVEAAASKEPTPGGGAIAAITAATGAALAEMVANLTIDKKGYESVQEEMKIIQQQAEVIRNKALDLAEADMQVFTTFMSALGLPKETDEEKAKRTEALQVAYKDAANVPLEIGKLSYEIFDLAHAVVTKGNTNLVTDGVIAAINARAAVKSAFLNVRINLSGIKDSALVADMTAYMDRVEADLDERERQIVNLYKG